VLYFVLPGRVYEGVALKVSGLRLGGGAVRGGRGVTTNYCLSERHGVERTTLPSFRPRPCPAHSRSPLLLPPRAPLSAARALCALTHALRALGRCLAQNGTRLKYPGNGFATLLVTAVAYVFLVSAGLVSPTYVYDNFVPLLGAVVAFAAAVTVALYLKSFARGAVLADEGNTGYPWYDAFMGRELNPRVGGLDLKYFFELRPGLIGWVLMNAAMVSRAAAPRRVASRRVTPCGNDDETLRLRDTQCGRSFP
jgi:hypothetical protein